MLHSKVITQLIDAISLELYNIVMGKPRYEYRWNSEKHRYEEVKKVSKGSTKKYYHYTHGHHKYPDEALGPALSFMIIVGLLAWIMSLIFGN